MKIVYIASPYTVGDVAVNVKTQMDTESRGADAEVELAKSLKIPVVYNIGSLK